MRPGRQRHSVTLSALSRAALELRGTLLDRGLELRAIHERQLVGIGQRDLHAGAFEELDGLVKRPPWT